MLLKNFVKCLPDVKIYSFKDKDKDFFISDL